MMTFDSGCPALFWVFTNTDALVELQTFIQRIARGKNTGDGGGPGVGVGSMVLARYSVDKVLYRAKVEDVIDDDLFSVSIPSSYIISFQSTSMAETETAAWFTGSTQNVFTEALSSEDMYRVQEERKQATEKIASKERPGIIIKYEILLKL